ncbi:MAG: DUF4399 domain-containing protein [Cytophagales bacterium]|nr:DUF4399 domain-containing protein [Cytophagales bacterium]
MMNLSRLYFSLCLIICVFLLSCGGKKEQEKAESSTEQVNEEAAYGRFKDELDINPDVVPRVFFRNLQDGDIVESPLYVEMAVQGWVVRPAGKVKKYTGHHHILINRPFIPKGEIVPKDENNLHFGKGEINTVLNLAPGKYTLCLQFADGAHVSYGKELSSTINIIVEEPTRIEESTGNENTDVSL